MSSLTLHSPEKVSHMSEILSRREALKRTALACAGVGLAGAYLPSCAEAGSPLRMKEAQFYEKLSGNRVQCKLCPRECTVADRGRGNCGVRENRGGTYYTLVYGSAAAVNVDPIEKKPLFHFLPGSRVFSLGTAGCNLHCRDCQNWEISQSRPEDVDSDNLQPDKVAAMAKSYSCKVLAYTYNEPVICYEYMSDNAEAGRKVGLRSVMISNGYINRDPMRKLLPKLDAVKIDWKGVTEEFYRKYCNATLQPVLNTLNRVKALGKWLEIVYLVVPTVNDSEADLRGMARWTKTYLGTEVPVHFSRFMPNYQLRNLPPTPIGTLERCHDIARSEGLSFVYLGNVPGHRYESTYCPKCGKTLLKRWGFEVQENNLRDGKCGACGKAIPGIWS